jgi:N-acetylmuramic acid 6-phosphate etherase
VGISADGRQDFVLDGIQTAKEIGMKTIVLTHNPGTEMEQLAGVAIVPTVGPEVLLGSTRMKVGVAQKMVLTMMSTTTMVRLGRTYGNLMVNIRPNNNKLMERAKRLIMIITKVDYEQAETALKAADGDIKVAVVMLKTGSGKAESVALLEAAGGNLRTVIG